MGKPDTARAAWQQAADIDAELAAHPYLAEIRGRLGQTGPGR